MSTLTRAQFDQSCKAYVAAHPDDTGVKSFPSGWTWTEHPHVPNLGYLSRTVQLHKTKGHSRRAEEDDGDGKDLEENMREDDDAACTGVPGEPLTCIQYVVHSATFEVPTFYFTVHDSSGSPLSLHQILESSVFRAGVLPDADGNTFALTLPESSFALLSQGDHPTLGTPSWYFHPCHTAEGVGEIIVEFDVQRVDPLRWMEAWFMIMGNIVNFFEGHVCL